VSTAGNLFADIPARLATEQTTTLLASPDLRIERIVSYGQSSPADGWYDQAQAEWVIVLAGAAQLQFEDESTARRMEAGDYVHIAPHRRHRVAWTDPTQATVWLAVHHG
jgi:cupin 2 domain-containing protein